MRTDEPTELKTPLDFRPDEAKARVKALATIAADARLQRDRLRGALGDAEADLSVSRHHLQRQAAQAMALVAAREEAAAARYLGEPPPKDLPSTEIEAPPPVDGAALLATIQGLRRRLEEAEERVNNAEAAYRSACIEEIVEKAPLAIAECYAAHAKGLVECWVAMETAEAVGRSVYGTSYNLVGPQPWGRLEIPGAGKQLPALWSVSEDLPFGPSVFRAQDARERGIVIQGLSVLAKRWRREIGEYTLDKRR